MEQLQEIELLLLKTYPTCKVHKNQPMTHICISSECDKQQALIGCNVCLGKFHGQSKLHKVVSLKDYFIQIKELQSSTYLQLPDLMESASKQHELVKNFYLEIDLKFKTITELFMRQMDALKVSIKQYALENRTQMLETIAKQFCQQHELFQIFQSKDEDFIKSYTQTLDYTGQISKFNQLQKFEKNLSDNFQKMNQQIIEMTYELQQLNTQTIQNCKENLQEIQKNNGKSNQQYNLIYNEKSEDYNNHQAAILDVGFNEKYFASCGADQTISIYDKQQQIFCAQLKGHKNKITSLCFFHHQNKMITCSKDKHFKIWDLDQFKCIKTIDANSNSIGVNSITLSKNDKTLVSGHDDFRIRTWNIDTGEQQNQMYEHEGEVMFVKYSPSGQYFLSSGNDGFLRLWNSQSLQCTTFVKNIHNIEVSGTIASISEDEQLIVVAGPADCITFLKFNSLKMIQNKKQAHDSNVRSVAISKNGLQLASGDQRGTIKVWNIQTMIVQNILEGFTGWISCLNWDQNILFGASNGTILKLWKFDQVIIEKSRLSVDQSRQSHQSEQFQY